jgi:hypothetical protein
MQEFIVVAPLARGLEIPKMGTQQPSKVQYEFYHRDNFYSLRYQIF